MIIEPAKFRGARNWAFHYTDDKQTFIDIKDVLMLDIDGDNDTVDNAMMDLELFARKNGARFRLYRTQNGMHAFRIDRKCTTAEAETFKFVSGTDSKYFQLSAEREAFAVRLSRKAGAGPVVPMGDIGRAQALPEIENLLMLHERCMVSLQQRVERHQCRKCGAEKMQTSVKNGWVCQVCLRKAAERLVAGIPVWDPFDLKAPAPHDGWGRTAAKAYYAKAGNRLAMLSVLKPFQRQTFFARDVRPQWWERVATSDDGCYWSLRPGIQGEQLRVIEGVAGNREKITWKIYHQADPENFRVVVADPQDDSICEVREKSEKKETISMKDIDRCEQVSSFPTPQTDPYFVWAGGAGPILDAVNVEAHHMGAANVLFTGDPGTGKTTAAMQFAAATERGFFALNCATIKSVGDWAGSRELVDGQTVFMESGFVKACESPNTVVFLDEINRTPVVNLGPLFSLLDFQRSVYLEGMRREVKVAKGVVFIAAANVGGQFTGTQQLDPALMDRFDTEVLFCLPGNDDLALSISEKVGIGVDTAEMLVRLGHAMASTFGLPFSMRRVLGAAKKMKYGLPARDAVGCTMFGGLSREGGVASEWATAQELLEGLNFEEVAAAPRRSWPPVMVSTAVVKALGGDMDYLFADS